MKLKMFSVVDVKVGAYMTPFFMRSRGEALRAWASTVNDGKSSMCAFPTDFCLYELGEFDDEKGEVVLYETKVSLGMALEFKKQPVDEVPPVLKAIEEAKGKK